MSRSRKEHKFILCIIDKVTNYLITVPMYQSIAEEVGKALTEHVITKILYSQLYNNGSGQCIYVLPL